MSNASKMATQREETAQSSNNGDLGDRSSAEPRMSLKPPKQLDFEAPDLPLVWERWKEELTLCMDLGMTGKPEAFKVKLFLYFIVSNGIEIYETLSFTSATENRTLEKVGV